jgi:phosphatidylglycerol:prolipoprotein diacylglycerol transferase
MDNAYPAIFILGALASFIWLGFFSPSPKAPSQSSRRTLSSTTHIDAALLALFLGLIGARAGFVYLHWEYYTNHPIEIFWFWQGGLTWPSGAVTAVLGIGLFARYGGHSFWSLMDTLAIPAAIMNLVSWSGCFLDGCAYGIQMPESILTPGIEDMFGSIAPRWPTQIAGTFSGVIILALIFILSNRQVRRGVLGWTGLALIAVSAFALSFTRADPAMLIGEFRLDTIGSTAVLLTAMCGFVLAWFKKPDPQVKR